MTTPLRLKTFEISGFRAFGSTPQLLDFRGGDGTRELTVLHGANASGKSSALAGIDLMFRAWLTWLRLIKPQNGSGIVPWSSSVPPYSLWISRRDWNVRVPHDAVRLVATFDGLPIEKVTVELQPAGEGGVKLRVETEPDPGDVAAHNKLRELLECGLGTAGSLPFALINTHRRGPWLVPEVARQQAKEHVSVLSDLLLTKLAQLQQSLVVSEKQRWRAINSLAGRFESLQGFELTVSPDPITGGRTLVAEKPGEMILRFDELSSGEQQVLAICASVVAAGAPIVAIEEPETNLSPKWQKTLREVLSELVARGTVHQVLLESHVQSFDGPDVLRFCRDDEGQISIDAAAATAEPSDPALHKEAVQAGAKQRWVTAEGYTQLPAPMLEHLDLRRGGHLWFLQHGEHWEAWPEAELDRALGGDESEGE